MEMEVNEVTALKVDPSNSEQAKAWDGNEGAYWAENAEHFDRAVARSYLAGTGPFPERAAVLSVVGRFLTEFADMVNAWADSATATIETWPDDPSQAEPDWNFMRRLARRDPDR